MSTQLFHSLQFDDVDAAMAFLTAVGFTERVVYRDDAGTVMHAEFGWREHGGVMFGPNRHRDADDTWVDVVGRAQCYCVAATDDDVDRIYAAALAAGATGAEAPNEADYGGRTCAVRDAEGNQWSFGTYPGASA